MDLDSKYFKDLQEIPYKGDLSKGEVNFSLKYLGKFYYKNAKYYVHQCLCGKYLKLLNKPSDVRNGSYKRCNECKIKYYRKRRSTECLDLITKGFNTPKGGLLTVRDVPDEVLKKTKIVLECSICSKDTELWPYGSIIGYVSQLQVRNPCGCSYGIAWTERQNIIRIKRRLIEFGFEFKGFIKPYNKGKTKVIIYNSITGNTWNSQNINQVLSKPSDPEQKGEKLGKSRSKSDEYYKESFKLLGGYNKNSVFTKNLEKVNFRGHHTFWDVTCADCKEIHTQERSVIRRGSTACSCNCKTGGYSVHKRGIFYISLWDGFIKSGITNVSAESRLSSQSNKSGLEGTLICTYVNEDGKFIRDLERKVQTKFKCSVVSKSTFPDGYSETHDLVYLQSIIDYLEQDCNVKLTML